MKSNAHTVATLFQSRAVRRAQDGDPPVELRLQPETSQEPTVRIVHLDNDQGVPEDWLDPPGSPQTYPDGPPKDTAWVYVLGIAIILYFLVLMFMLFG